MASWGDSPEQARLSAEAPSANIAAAGPLERALALVGDNRERALAFVQSELAPIEAAGERSERLLRTLRTYLEHGQRVTNASAVSGHHRDTIHSHLRDIEQLLGCRIEQRSAELLWALRLHEALNQAHTRNPHH